MTHSELTLNAQGLIQELTNELAELHALFASIDIPPIEHDNLELAEINLCLAETTLTDSPQHSIHYTQAGFRALSDAYCAALTAQGELPF